MDRTEGRLSVVGSVGLWALLLAAAVGVPLLGSSDPGDSLIRNTIRLSLVYYAAAAVLLLQMQPADWAGGPAFALARSCWTLAWLTFLIHLGMAGHFFHHWSHAHAVEHTARATGGNGWGIYVSHTFTLLWTLDVVAWRFRPAWYAARPAWIDWALHAFMAIIIFNGTVIFEQGFIRWAGLLMFVGLGVLWINRVGARTVRPRPGDV
jgi:hypothetical protein